MAVKSELAFSDLMRPSGYIMVQSRGGIWGRERASLVSAMSAVMADLAIQNEQINIRFPTGEPYTHWGVDNLQKWWDVVKAASRFIWGDEPPQTTEEVVNDGLKWTWESAGTPGRWVSFELTSNTALVSWDSATGATSTFIYKVLSKHLSPINFDLFDDWGNN